MIELPAFLLSNWRLIAAGAALVTVFGMGWEANGWRLQRELAETRAEHSRQVSEAAQARADEERAQRAVEASREAAKQEVDHVASLARARAESDRRGADAAHERLLYAAAIAAARAGAACQDPGAAGERQAADDEPMRALRIVLDEADEEAGRMGAAADIARAAGLGCERLHDAVSK